MDPCNLLEYPTMTKSSKLTCPICANFADNTVLSARKNVPTLQNVALGNCKEAIDFPTGKLTMVRCKKCSFN